MLDYQVILCVFSCSYCFTKIYEPAHDKTYNKRCNQQRFGSAFTSVKSGQSSLITCAFYSLQAIQRGTNETLAILVGWTSWADFYYWLLRGIILLLYLFALFVLFLLVCCSMMFRVILILFDVLGGMCYMIMAFHCYPIIYIRVNGLKFYTQKFLTKWPMQTVQTQIRLLLKEQSDQGLHCLPFHCI